MVSDIAPTQPLESFPLPAPRLASPCSVEMALQGRRSVRALGQKPLALAQLAQLLWAAQGVTSTEGMRTAPSAGALYPLELYLAVGNVSGLAAGVYKYQPEIHHLKQWAEHDRRHDLASAALGQDFVKRGAAVMVFASVQARTTGKYGERGIRYIHFEVGHAAQNVLLQAVALGLSAVTVGAFDDKHVARLLQIPPSEQALYLLPIGKG